LARLGVVLVLVSAVALLAPMVDGLELDDVSVLAVPLVDPAAVLPAAAPALGLCCVVVSVVPEAGGVVVVCANAALARAALARAASRAFSRIEAIMLWRLLCEWLGLRNTRALSQPCQA
jgi:hypothetical protein